MNFKIEKHFKLNHIRLISAIADSGQLSQAASILSITQPAASRTLAEIEHKIGAKIVDRLAKGVEFTPIGRVLAKRCQSLLTEMKTLTQEIEELKHGLAGTCTIGAVTGAAVGLVIPAVQQLKAVSPKTEISVNVGISEVLVQDMESGINDFVLARIPRKYNANAFDITSSLVETVQLMVREDHPLASAKNIELEELISYEWVIQSQRAPLRETVEAAFLKDNIELPNNITNSTSLLVLIASLVSSSAIAPMASEVSALLTGNSVGAKLRALNLKKSIEVPPYHLLGMKGRALSPVASKLQALIKLEIKQRHRLMNIH